MRTKYQNNVIYLTTEHFLRRTHRSYVQVDAVKAPAPSTAASPMPRGSKPWESMGISRATWYRRRNGSGFG